MPDISMCTNAICKSNEKCYRYMAEPSEYRQSYAMFKPKLDGKCDYFWEIEAAATKLRKDIGNERNKV